MISKAEDKMNETHYLSMQRKILRLFKITAVILAALICFVLATLYFQDQANHAMSDELSEYSSFDNEFTEFSSVVELFLLTDIDDTETLTKIQASVLKLNYLDEKSDFTEEYNKRLRTAKTILYTVIQESLDDPSEDSLYTSKESLFSVVNEIRQLIKSNQTNFLKSSQSSEEKIHLLTGALYAICLLTILTLLVFRIHAKRSLKSIVNTFIEQEDKTIHQREEAQKHRMHNQRLRSIGTIAKGMSHEINNPLAIIKGHLNLLEGKHKNDKTDTPRHLTKITSALSRVTDIVKKMGIYTSLDDTEHEIVDLSSVLTTSFVKSTVNNDAIKITCLHETDSSTVLADISTFEITISNILKNAGHAVNKRSSPRISVLTKSTDSYFHIQITDNGVGIKENDLKLVFDPFFTTNGIGEGTGLGLTVAHTIISSFGGEIDIDSVLDQGTTVTIKIPCASHATDSPEIAAS